MTARVRITFLNTQSDFISPIFSITFQNNRLNLHLTQSTQLIVSFCVKFGKTYGIHWNGKVNSSVQLVK